MIDRTKKQGVRPQLWLIALIGVAVPQRLRADWRQEWEAELRYRELLLAEWDRLDWRNKLDLLWRSTSAFWDALRLQPKRLEDEVFQDLRFGMRILLKYKVVSLVAMLSLALGIGANTAIFSLIEATLLRMLPVKDPQQLVLFSIVGQGQTQYDFSYPLFERLRENRASFSGLIAASGLRSMRLQEAGGAVETIQPERVSGNYFSVLGVNPVLGRVLNDEDDSAANPQSVAVLSYDFWQRRFGLDPAVVGKKVMLDDFPFTIVGVTPRNFAGLEVGRQPDLWWPVRAITLVTPDSQALKQDGYWWLKVMGRLQPGANLDQARAEMDLLLKQQMAAYVAKYASMPAGQRRFWESLNLELEAGGTGWTLLRHQFKKTLLILMIVVVLVLLIACLNVANLLLARAAARRKEIAVRLALGASRTRLVRQLFTESVLLAVLGGALGLLFARWGTGVLLSYLPQQNPVLLDLRPAGRVLGFTLGASLLSGLLFGLAPAWQATRLELTNALKDHAGVGGRSLRLTLSKALVVAQVALSLLLLIGAGLFVRSLESLKTLDPGFNREDLVQFRLDAGKGYNAAQRANLYRQALARLEALPGVRAASFSTFSLLSGDRIRNKVIVPGYVAQNDDEATCNTLWVGPRFFAAMGMNLVAGRDFDSQDAALNDSVAGPQAPLVAVINQTMARRFFGNENAIGKRFSHERGPQQSSPPIEIVGVVKDAKYRSLREAAPPTFYLAWFQQPGTADQTFQLRTAGDPWNLAPAIRRTIQEIDPKLQVTGLRTMEERIDESLVQERFLAQLSGFLSLFALLLACLGLYGVMSQAVARRTHEFGIQMALGATARRIVALVSRETLWLVGLGVVIGVGVALAATRWVQSLLFGLQPHDPLTIGLAVFILLAVAAVAGYLPARRASRLDPMVALRHE